MAEAVVRVRETTAIATVALYYFRLSVVVTVISRSIRVALPVLVRVLLVVESVEAKRLTRH